MNLLNRKLQLIFIVLLTFRLVSLSDDITTRKPDFELGVYSGLSYSNLGVITPPITFSKYNENFNYRIDLLIHFERENLTNFQDYFESPNYVSDERETHTSNGIYYPPNVTNFDQRIIFQIAPSFLLEKYFVSGFIKDNKYHLSDSYYGLAGIDLNFKYFERYSRLYNLEVINDANDKHQFNYTAIGDLKNEKDFYFDYSLKFGFGFKFTYFNRLNLKLEFPMKIGFNSDNKFFIDENLYVSVTYTFFK